MNNMPSTSDFSFEKAAIHVSDLPALELYIDQVITLIEQCSAANRRGREEKPLTKMMINNYSKAGLVRPIKGKKYTREHIVQMLIICALKGTLSMNDIKSVIDSLYALPEFDGSALFDVYEKALIRQDEALSSLNTLLEPSMLSKQATVSERFSSLISVCAMSDALSQLAGQMVDELFAAPEKPAKVSKEKP